MGDSREHSIFPPSASKRWLACPGSIKLSEKAPPQEDTEASITGVHAHSLSEICLKTNTNAKEHVKRGTPFTGVMAVYVQKYVDYVRKHHQINGGTLHVEKRLTMPKLDGRLFGSADVVQVTKYKTLHIFDLKYGMWTVEVDANTQMMLYLIGALSEFKDQIDLRLDVKAHICQPRPVHKDGEFRSIKFSIKDLIEFGKIVKSAIKEADSDEPKLVDGDHCTFCPAEFICPKLNAFGRKVFI